MNGAQGAKRVGRGAGRGGKSRGRSPGGVRSRAEAAALIHRASRGQGGGQRLGHGASTSVEPRPPPRELAAARDWPSCRRPSCRGGESLDTRVHADAAPLVVRAAYRAHPRSLPWPRPRQQSELQAEVGVGADGAPVLLQKGCPNKWQTGCRWRAGELSKRMHRHCIPARCFPRAQAALRGAEANAARGRR